MTANRDNTINSKLSAEEIVPHQELLNFVSDLGNYFFYHNLVDKITRSLPENRHRITMNRQLTRLRSIRLIFPSKPNFIGQADLLNFNENLVRNALEQAWSRETAVQWSKENPANGQCNVTSVVIFDLFGGDILRTRYPEFWHYYNRVDGQRLDLTDSQFTRPGARFTAPESYDDVVATREQAMHGIPEREYDALRYALLKALDIQDSFDV